MLPTADAGGVSWKMVEVKSSTSVKDYHRDDVAVQSFLARAMGVPLSSVSVACIDSSWVYPGGNDYRGLLAENDLTEETLERSEEVTSWISEAHQISNLKTEPEVDTGDQCHKPFECGFCDYCNRDKAVPEFPLDSYEELDGIKDGGMAMSAFAEAIHPDTSPERKEEIRTQLLSYCCLDTLAMVGLWKVFSGRDQPPLA